MQFQFLSFFLFKCFGFLSNSSSFETGWVALNPPLLTMTATVKLANGDMHNVKKH